jgi:UDP-N-acetylmuramyl pentapeptide phosphotransferase/UDP-N-acetylglucosamine-1-phosphate transferase
MRDVHSDLDVDGGAQPQRTMLAWNRTVTSSVLGCATVAFTAQRQHMPVVAVLAAVAAVMLVGLLDDLRHWRADGRGRYWLMRQAAGAVCVLAALGAVVAIRGAIG